MPEEWRRALEDTERLRLLPIILREGAPDNFPHLTVRELRSELRLPVTDALGILAKIEAINRIPKLGRSPAAGWDHWRPRLPTCTGGRGRPWTRLQRPMTSHLAMMQRGMIGAAVGRSCVRSPLLERDEEPSPATRR